MANKFTAPPNAAPIVSQKVPVDKLVRVGNYELEKTIGKGNFAVVKLASNSITKSKVAIKIIDKTCLDEDNLAKTYREISILKLMRHPHITRLYEVMESRHFIYLVTEHAARGEIFDHLVANGRMKEEEAARIFAQLCSAIVYCHQKGVVHRDLKAENVLLDDDMNVKLADFGFCNTYTEGIPMSTWCGSPPYAAPEVFQGLEYDGPKADIWSLGVVLYVLVCGALPFDGRTLHDLRNLVVAGKFRIPFFMSQDCEHLIRHMLVGEAEKRYTLRQITRHRWLSQYSIVVQTDDQNITTSSSHPITTEPILSLDTTVVSHMLQLSGLTSDMIGISVHEKRFDHIYAIYNLLVDKLSKKRKEQLRLQHHASLAYSRTRKASITTGIVERTPELIKVEPDRLSPLTNSFASFNLLASSEMSNHTPDELEKFDDIDIDPNIVQTTNELDTTTTAATTTIDNQSQTSALNGGHPNTRRHTVGPGDVAHEQALSCPVAPLNFKFGVETGTNIPMNLPMMQNQPLHNLTIKDQHLLKPPTVMGATGAFGRRASDGGANLQIYYPATANNIPPIENMFSTQNSRECLRITGNVTGTNVNVGVVAGVVGGMGSSGPDSICGVDQRIEIPMEQRVPNFDVSDESNDEIQRYMQSRGCGKRHTVGCTDDLSQQSAVGVGNSMDQNLSHSPAPSTSSGRTRRTGLLTVMERPPVISPDLIREVEARMKRNYLPPSLMSATTNLPQNPTNCIGATIQHNSQSPPVTSRQLVQSQNAGGTSSTAAGGGSRPRYSRTCKLPTVQEVGRYSPVRRASEGSRINTQFQGALQECQQLQKGLTQPRHLLITPSPPLADNSVSLPGSPSHCKPFEDKDSTCSSIIIPSEMLKSIVPALELLVNENRISVETANSIITSRCVPYDIGHSLGIIPQHHPQHSIINGLDLSSQQSTTQQQHQQQHPHQQQQLNHNSPNSMIPLNFSKYQIGAGGGIIIGGRSVSPNIVNSNSNSNCPSPCYSNYNSGCASPNYGGGGSSPMHQITKGLSILNTGSGGGSITRGTSAVMESNNAAAAAVAAQAFSNQPLDLSMDVTESIIEPVTYIPGPGSPWFVSPSFYDVKTLNLSPAQQVRIVPTPPASPNLCIIQEELHPSTSSSTCLYSVNNNVSQAIDDSAYGHSHPQICLTDVQGSEITLVALSDTSSRDSDDSLDMQNSSMTLQGLVITEPSSDMPSITRGIGRKTSLENEAKAENAARRGSDKSLGFSDDSLSNDSNNLSPLQEPSAASSSGFKSGADSHSELERLSPDSLSEFRLTDEYYELPLPHECSNLDSSHIIELIKKTIYSKMPPKGFVINNPVDISNFSLEYSGGLQIELQVCDGRNSKDNSCTGKGIKLRRISGDQFEYGKLCQQLISSLTV